MAPSARRLRRHPIPVAAVGLLLTLHAAGCTSDDAPDRPGLAVDCGMVDEASITASLGVSAVEVSDESTDSGGTAQLLCRYTPTEPDTPTLVVRAAPEATSGQAARDLAATETSCDDPRRLDVEDTTGFVCPEGSLTGGPQAYATWDGLDVRAALTQTRTPLDEPDAVLTAVVEQLRDELDAATFDAR
ncbi:hypothetical protein GCM10009821_28280 [Aeromicrobium halocynthiae]|uniref:DUF3558 domain-containing protein n=1 Tax=Aeromicrobium halocynthiae TaxID=560557 RepID=A0ABN2W6L4_9ACTN